MKDCDTEGRQSSFRLLLAIALYAWMFGLPCRIALSAPLSAAVAVAVQSNPGGLTGQGTRRGLVRDRGNGQLRGGGPLGG